MAKYKKKVHFIDMSERLNIKIIHEEMTEADNQRWEDEFEDIKRKVTERMKVYDKQIEELFASAKDNINSETVTKDADYFIETYEEKFRGRNNENIKSRWEVYGKYLK